MNTNLNTQNIERLWQDLNIVQDVVDNAQAGEFQIIENDEKILGAMDTLISLLQ